MPKVVTPRMKRGFRQTPAACRPSGGARKAIVEAEDLEGPAYQTCINAAANETALWDRPPERQVPMTAARLFEKEPERA
jgi:hypothetical protein